jgi:hypothetical protein
LPRAKSYGATQPSDQYLILDNWLNSYPVWKGLVSENNF